jgi:hypothetical protein
VGVRQPAPLNLGQGLLRPPRARGKDHHAALRTLGSRWLEILWHCLQRQVPDDEAVHLANRTRALQPAA